MSQASSQASAFYREVAKTQVVWTIKDAGGFPAPETRTGERAMPFWSSKSRVERIIATVAAYKAFVPHEISWSDFDHAWVPGLEKDGLLIGVNWSGAQATGYDVRPTELRAAVNAIISGDPGTP